MKTKIVETNNTKVTLYLDESTGKWVLSKEKATDLFHKRILESDDKKARTIRRYYSESTIDYTRSKIREMVNTGKIDQLYDTIINEILGNKQDD